MHPNEGSNRLEQHSVNHHLHDTSGFPCSGDFKDAPSHMEQRCEVSSKDVSFGGPRGFAPCYTSPRVLAPITLRGGMIVGETRTPSLLSGDLQRDTLETNTATRSSSLCSDNIPDLGPIPGIVNNQVDQPALVRRVTPVTFIDRTESATVLIPEPSQLHLPRSVAQENIERAQGTIATNTTPVLGPVRSPHEGNSDLAEYVDHRFGLDGTENSLGTPGHLVTTGVTFTVPNYRNHVDVQEAVSPDGEVLTDTTLHSIDPRRISDALQSMCTRVREFFPTTDVVTSRRTSVAPSTSRSSRVSVTLQRALGEQNLITRAANMIIPNTHCRQPAPQHGCISADGASDLRERSSSLRSEQDRRPADPQTSPIKVTASAGTGIFCRRASEPIMRRINQDALTQSNTSPYRNLSNTDQKTNINVVIPNKVEEPTDSPSLVQRAWNRLSTTFTSSSRFGSYDSACAPPPTRDECSHPERDHGIDAEAKLSHSNSNSKASKLGKRLRHFGSSTMNLARRGVSRSRNVTSSKGPQTADEGVLKSAGTELSSSPGQVPRRHVLPSEWRGSVGRVTARLRRRNTPVGSNNLQHTGNESFRDVDDGSEGCVPTDDTAKTEIDDSHQNKAQSSVVGSVNITGQATRGGSERRQTSMSNLKSMIADVRELSRSEQNVIPL